MNTITRFVALVFHAVVFFFAWERTLLWTPQIVDIDSM